MQTRLLRLVIPAVAAVLFMGASGAVAQNSIMLTVLRKQTGDKDQTQSRYSRSSSVTAEKQMELDITVRNQSAQAANVSVEWYCIAGPLEHEFSDYVFSYGTNTYELAPWQGTNTVEKSRTIISKLANSRGKVTKTGAKPIGYIVRVMQDGKLVACKADPGDLDKKARNDDALAELINAPPVDVPAKKAAAPARAVAKPAAVQPAPKK